MYKIEYFPSEIEKTNDNKPPVLIIFGFLQSNLKVLMKYRNLYTEFDSFIYAPPMDISSILLTANIKQLIKKIHNVFTNNGKDLPKSTNITLHALSIGTGLVSTFLRCLKELDNGKYNYLFPMIKSIVLDSGFFINSNDAFSGLSVIFKSKGGLSSLVPYTFPLVKPLWKTHFEREIPILLNINCNLLVIYDKNDQYFPNQSKIFLDLVKNIDNKNNEKNDVKKRTILECEFQNSEHCKHLKNYPDQYEKKIRELLLISN